MTTLQELRPIHGKPVKQNKSVGLILSTAVTGSVLFAVYIGLNRSLIVALVDDIKAVLSGMLAPEIREKFLGNAEILEVFNISKVGKVAGCRVTEGYVRRGAKVRLIRDDVVIHEGDLSTLKRFKDEVREVQAGQECGMAFANYQDIQKGDVIECYEVETIKRTL